MSGKGWVNKTISFDTAKFKKEITDAANEFATNVTNEIIELIKQEMSAAGDVTDDPSGWYSMIENDIKILTFETVGSKVHVEFGLDYAQGTGSWMKAMVIAYGSGSRGLTGVPMTAGPLGRQVWDSGLDSKISSKIEKETVLPSGWNHAGYPYFENGLKNAHAVFSTLMEKYKPDITEIIRSCMSTK